MAFGCIAIKDSGSTEQIILDSFKDGMSMSSKFELSLWILESLLVKRDEER
jgi:hypothetical protein